MNILLISNKLFHYRIPVYNYFSKRFKDNGFEFFVLATEIQEDIQIKIDFNLKVIRPSLKKYQSYIQSINPVTIIFFMHLRDRISWQLLWTQRKKTPIIYWGHGVNLQDSENRIKNFCYHIFHRFSDAIILYSNNEQKHIKYLPRDKIFIAPNSLNDKYFPKIPESKEALKKYKNLTDYKIVLFVSRISPIKRLTDLVAASNLLNDNIKIIIIGPGLEDSLLTQIKTNPKIEYWGTIYDSLTINKAFKMSDLFCIPGMIGLSINQALYWGLPTITEDVKHSPEITYLKNGENGFIVPKGDILQLADRINHILSADEILLEFSEKSKSIIQSEANIEKMFDGFLAAVQYVLDKGNGAKID